MCADIVIVESDENLVNWNNKNIFDQENEHFSSPEEVSPSSNSFDVGFGFRSPHDDSYYKKIKLSFNQQEEEFDTSEESSPLGLKLNKSPSLVSLLERKLFVGEQANNNNTPTKSVDCNCENKKSKKKLDFASQPMSEKLKASNFPAMLLKIGSWEKKSMHEGDLVAKCYFAKRKIVWEVLKGALKSKIEMQWSDIVGIRATISDDEPGTLEIELHQPPSFFRETDPQPRKHTLWATASDFTGGQALIFRRHYMRFAPGTLDKHYEKLLQCDQRLLLLSQRPFPSQESPYFDANVYELPEFPLDYGYGSQCFPGLQFSYQNFPAGPFQVQNLRQVTRPPRHIMDSISPMPVNDLMLENQRRAMWNEVNFATGNHIQPTRPIITPVTNANFPCQIGNPMAYEQVRRNSNADMALLSIENHLLGGENTHLASSSHENTITPSMGSMYSLLDPQEMVNPINEQMILEDNSGMLEGQVFCPEPTNWTPHDLDGIMTTNSPPNPYALLAMGGEFSTPAPTNRVLEFW